MFDMGEFERLVSAAGAVGVQPAELATVDQLAEAMRSVRQVVDRLEGLEASLLQGFEEVDGPTVLGASSTAAWARRELRLDPRQARARVRAGRTLRQLPQVAQASRAGRIRLDHVQEFTAGITKTGVETMAAAQDYLVPVARTCDPAELRAMVHQLVDVVHPERLDQAWADGMDKQDLKISRVGDGFAMTGFLDVVTGAAVKTWLDAAAAPADADDPRPPSRRRVDAVRQLVQQVLEHGMPSDRGVRPQLHVMADLDTVLGDPAGSPAELAGYGPIGPELLDYLRCTADLTPLLTHGETTGPTPQAAVLNVGRTARLATGRQRTAVHARQHGVCAAPGCRNTHLEIHHTVWWSHGGATDLNDLVGLCPRCHHLIHARKLAVERDGAGGFVFTRHTRDPLHDHWRRHRTRIRAHLRTLRRTPETIDHAPSTSTARSGDGRVIPRDPRRGAQTSRPRSIDLGPPAPSLPESWLHLTLARHPRINRRQ